MVLQPTPVKRLLAEQLAVPSPQLSRLLASLLAAPPLPLPPTADFIAHLMGSFLGAPLPLFGGASDDM